MAEVFKIQNTSTNTIELIDFGLIIPPNEIVELGSYDETVLSTQVNNYINNGTIIRLINDVSVSAADAFSSTVDAVSSKFIDLMPLADSETPVYKEGRLYYNEDGEILTFNTSNSNVRIGREIYLKVYNNTGQFLSKGTAVKISGGIESSAGSYATVELARADNTYDFNSTILVTKTDIINDTYGLALSYGVLYNHIDTSSFTAGDSLYLSDTIWGGITNIAPKYKTIYVGKCVYPGINSGKILVNIKVAPSNGFIEWNNNSNNYRPFVSQIEASLSDNLNNGSRGKLFNGVAVLDSSYFKLNYNGQLVSYDIISQNKLYLDYDERVYIFSDASKNLIFSDPNSGNISLKTLTNNFVTYSYVDGSLNRLDSSILSLFNKINKTDSSLYILTNRVSSLESSTANNVSKNYVDVSLLNRDASISWLFYNKLENSNLYPYATNASVGIALQPYATNASVGIALQPYATNASVGIALQPYATNASVGIALQPYATNTSTNIEFSKRDTSILWLNSNKLSGSGGPTQIALWDNNNLITSNPLFIRDPSSGHIAMGTNLIDNDSYLIIDNGVAEHNTITRFMGSFDGFVQTEIKNNASGPSASADIVASNDIGNNNINYINLGINSTTYGAPDSFPGDGYLLLITDASSVPGNLIIGNGTYGKDLILFTGDNLAAYTNEGIRLTFDGSVFIGQPASQKYKLEVNGDINIPAGHKYLRNGVSLEAIYTTYTYVDVSLGVRDNRINLLDSSVSTLYSFKYLSETSLGTDFYWNGNVIDLSTSFKNKIRNSASDGYSPFYYKDNILHTNFLRNLVPQNGLIVINGADGSTAYLDSSINIPGAYTADNQPFSGNLNESFLRLNIVDKLVIGKVTNSFSEISNSGITQLPATTDPLVYQANWFPWGNVTWDLSGNSSVITWTDWLVCFANTQTVERCNFTFDVSNLSNNSYVVYFNNATGAPALEISTSLNRRAYPEKAFIGYITVLNGKVGYWHETPDLYGTPSVTRDRNSFGLTQIKGLNIYYNIDGSTLSLSSGQILIEGSGYRNIDYYNKTFTGAQNIKNYSAIQKINIVETDSSSGYIDQTYGVYQSLLSSKKRYYDSSSNTILSWSGAEKFIISEMYLLDNGYLMLRRGGNLYNTILDAIDNIVYFDNNASPISSIVAQIHPKLGWFIISTDCSSLSNELSFSIESFAKVGVSGGGSGIGIIGAENIGAGYGIFNSINNDIIQLKGISAGNTNSMNISQSSDTIILDVSIKNLEPSINDLYNIKTSKIYSFIQDVSISILDTSISYLSNSLSSYATNASVGIALQPYATNASVGIALQPYATNASVGIALQPYATNASVGIALQPYATNASVGIALQSYATKFYLDGSLYKRDISINDIYAVKANLTNLYPYATNASVGIALQPYATNASVGIALGIALQPYATNASVGIALQPYATNASVGIALQPYATNASVGIALQPYATNASVGIALQPYATNASVGIALQPYATNASVGIAGFAKKTYVDASLALRVLKIGDTMTGNIVFSSIATGISRDNSTNRLALYGGTGETDGAYFQVTGSNYVASPGSRSAEFVIGESIDSKYSLFSYDGIGVWTPRFSLQGNTGLVKINNDISIGGSSYLGNDSSIGINLPYAQIDVSNGKKIVSRGTYYGQEAKSTFHTNTTTTTAVTPTFTSDTSITSYFPAGQYKITASYGMNKVITNSDMISRLVVDGTQLGGVHNHELSDTATWLYTTRIWSAAFTQASHNIDLQFSQEATGTLSMRDVYLEVIRIN